MQTLPLKLTKWLIGRTIRKACPSTVPRSGLEGESVDCFITKIEQGDDPPPVVLEISGNEFKCIAWDGTHYSRDLTISISETKPFQFRIVHFYGLSEVRYTSLIGLLFGLVTRWPYIRIRIARAFFRVNQRYFNQKKLITRRRMDLLAFIVARQQSGVGDFDPTDLMTGLYTLRWVEHPDRSSAMRQIEFFLDAMIETGELAKGESGYRATGSALRALDEFVEQERKHGESVRLQKGMLWLSVVIAALAAIQADLIKLPTLLDFTK